MICESCARVGADAAFHLTLVVIDEQAGGVELCLSVALFDLVELECFGNAVGSTAAEVALIQDRSEVIVVSEIEVWGSFGKQVANF